MTIDLEAILGDEAAALLSHECQHIRKESLHLPGADFVDRVFAPSDRSPTVLRNLQALFSQGRLADTGYLSILPVDQGIEHTAAYSFGPNPIYFDPEHVVRLALEGGCSAVASTLGILGAVARRYAHRIPFIVKINHNELLTYPNTHDQILFARVEQAADLGAVAIGATIYFGAEESNRQIDEIGEAFQQAHEMGLGTILWCYLRNEGFEKNGVDYHAAADLTAQANHIGVTLQADIVKQKLPLGNRGFPELKFGKWREQIYTDLVTDNPIDLVRFQVANGFMGRAGLINSGGASSGDATNDLADALRTAVINKRGGGMGLILGRKAFQKPFDDGVRLLHAVQDVYRNSSITVA